ncbi:MAG TPA: hypothetical protein EYG79_14140 [Rhodobacteraceae bacterium]|nr:hypothetical protein [Paracoccaceae bacterium]
MNLNETSTLNSSDFPIAELKDQLRLGTGFSDSGAQDGLLETCLRAAMGAIEARTSRVLLRRRFQWSLYNWRLDGDAQALPFAPVSIILYLRVLAADGSITTVDPADYKLQLDNQRPKLLALKRPFPAIEAGGSAEVSMYAGYGSWAYVPAGLQNAMLMLAVSYYENRDGMINGGGQIPFGVSALLEPYKRVRLGAAR